MARGWIFNFFLEGLSSQTTCTPGTDCRQKPPAGVTLVAFEQSFWSRGSMLSTTTIINILFLLVSVLKSSLEFHHECFQLTSTSRIKASMWLESASFTENLDESSASVKKRCKKYLNQVATMSCNVSQRVSRKAVWKITRVEVVHFEFLLRLWNWTIIGHYSWYYNYVIVFLVF